MMKKNQVIIDEELKPKFWVRITPTFRCEESKQFIKDKLYPIYKTMTTLEETRYISGEDKIVESMLTIDNDRKLVWISEIWYNITIVRGLKGVENEKN